MSEYKNAQYIEHMIIKIGKCSLGITLMIFEECKQKAHLKFNVKYKSINLISKRKSNLHIPNVKVEGSEKKDGRVR